MGIFSKSKRSVFDMDDVADPVPSPAVYDTATDYLVGLSPQEYAMVLQVVNIYRDANAKAAKALGVPNNPTTHIKPNGVSIKATHDITDAEFLKLDSEPKRHRTTKAKKGKK